MNRRTFFRAALGSLAALALSPLAKASAAGSLLMLGAGSAGDAVEVGGTVLNEDTGGAIVIEAGGGNIARE
jgi:hypothetical protein